MVSRRHTTSRKFNLMSKYDLAGGDIYSLSVSMLASSCSRPAQRSVVKLYKLLDVLLSVQVPGPVPVPAVGAAGRQQDDSQQHRHRPGPQPAVAAR